MYSLSKILLLFIIVIIFTSCSNSDKDDNIVVVYVSVDQVFSSKILKQFEYDTGITVKAVYDTESSKAVGLEKRLLAEKKSPLADVFWNSEFLRTERLLKANVLRKDNSKINKYLKKIGLRGRVLIVNTNLVKSENYPNSLYDLIDHKYKGKVAMCSPYYGTASTHFAALYAKFGEKKFLDFIKALKKNNIALLSGNSVVKDAVGHGRYSIGLVDTDDALIGIKQGLPIKIIYYDQNKKGVFGIHQTISLIKGSPNYKNGQILQNYISTVKVEQQLIDMNAVQFPLLKIDKEIEQPKLWTLSGEDIIKGLKPSIKIMRSYLE